MDFVNDSLIGGRRIRILTIADLWDRSKPAFQVDMSLPGVRVVHVLERLGLQGRLPQRGIESFNGKFRDEHLNQSVFCPCTMPAEPLKPAGRIQPTAAVQLIGLADTGRISRKEHNLHPIGTRYLTNDIRCGVRSTCHISRGQPGKTHSTR